MFGWKDICLDGRTDVWMEGLMFGWKDRCLDGRTDVWMEGQMFGWKDRCLDGRTDVWIHGWIYKFSLFPSYLCSFLSYSYTCALHRSLEIYMYI